MRKYIPLIAAAAVVIVLLVIFRSSEPIKVPPPMASIKIACDIQDELADFTPPPTVEGLEVEAAAIEQRISPEQPLASRRGPLETAVCDRSLGMAQRGLALDVLIESEAIVTALDAGRSLGGNWHNRVTGSFGTVIVASTAEANGTVCRVVDYPSHSVFGLAPNMVANARESYCRPAGSSDWFLYEQISYEAYPIEDIDPNANIAPSNANPSTTV